MERVAVITDIHANLHALEATLDAIEGIDVDAVYCGGDLVGYGDRAIARDLDDCCCAFADKPAFAVLLLDEGAVYAVIERVDYDIAAVAHQVEAAGLPGEYAEKLLTAA